MYNAETVMAGISGRRIFFLDLRTWTRIVAFYHILSSVLEINREITWFACMQREQRVLGPTPGLPCQYYETVPIPTNNYPTTTLDTTVPGQINDNFKEARIKTIIEDSNATDLDLETSDSNNAITENKDSEYEDLDSSDNSTETGTKATTGYTQFANGDSNSKENVIWNRNWSWNLPRNAEYEREIERQKQRNENDGLNSNINNSNENNYSDEYAEEVEIYKWTSYIDLALHVIQMTVSVILFYGAQRGRPSMLITWLVFNGIILVLCIMVFVFVMLTTLPGSSFLLMTLQVCTEIFAFWVVAFHRRELLLFQHTNNKVTMDLSKSGRDFTQP